MHKVELKECFRCGKHKSFPRQVFPYLKLSECHTCKRKGHISPKCSQKIPGKPLVLSKPKHAEAKEKETRVLRKKKKGSRIKFEGPGCPEGPEGPEI